MRIQSDTLKPILHVRLVLIACAISALLFAPRAWGQTPEKDQTKTPDVSGTPSEFKGTVEIGVQAREIQGGHPAKFEEVRDVPKGFFVQKMTLDFISADSPYSLSVRGFEIRERDQRFTVEGGRVGKYRTQFVFDQVPHHFGSGQSFLQETEPGLYQVSPTLRARLQALTTPEARIPPNSVVSNLIRQELLTAP